ncbi:MAG: energy-coupling factor ABC transporter ATP-binding protein [Treponema sp.]|jgi:biotin transport system ATP-binding protein|nr:energy-coupling factor ABC transporter ATP-binding protein [Treponema sp.]
MNSPASTGQTSGGHPAGSLFEIRGLRKTFPGAEGEISALDGIDLDIAETECLLAAGPNGSGKTILVRILAALLEPSEGSIRFRGRSLAEAARDRRFRRELGIVFQDAAAQFVGETVEEDAAFGPANLGLDRAEMKDRVRRALEKTGLWEKRRLSPRRLSGGEKRRLAVAGVLAMGNFQDPPETGGSGGVIIMDEPFANLDFTGVVQVLSIIRTLKQEGVTLIILTHELEKVLALADRLVILDRGKIREDGKPAEVLDRLRPEYGVRDPRHSCRTVEDCSWLP